MNKYNLVVPLAGKGQRMIDGGYKMPKPLILVGDRHIIDYSLGSIDMSECNLIFVVRRDHICNYAIDKTLKKKFGSDIKIVVAERDTKGSVESCYLAKDLIDNEVPLIIFCPDIYFEPKFTPQESMFQNDGFILTFKANSSNYSYVQKDNLGFVTRTEEKIVISEDASVGVYCFKTGSLFIQTSEKAFKSNKSVNNEYYICPLYNIMINEGMKVRTEPVDIMYIMGTPDEMNFFISVIFPYFLNRTFILCCDHSGFEQKERVRNILISKNIKFIDCGCYSADNCDYIDYIRQAVETKKYFPGALIFGFCRSGQGVNICANKFPNIRGAIVFNEHDLSLTIRHNAANFLSIPAVVTPKELESIVETALVAKFEGGRHQNRLQKGPI